jgi:protein-S-isoprenylcysteine O-methyltransferase Ste14
MRLIPEFEIGLWNGWIFMLLYFLITYVPGYFINREKAKKAFSSPPYNKKEKNTFFVLEAIYFIALIYIVFLPLKLHTLWFYAGLFIYLLGMIMNALSVTSFATTLLDKQVTKGIYRISRNPFYLGYFLVCIGIGIACTSWIFLLYAIIYMILQHILIIPEERFCVEKYGDSYREYMDRTPRWIGIPKSRKR